MKEPLVFISIQPWLQNHIGHFFAYNMDLKKACEKNGWESFSLIPKDCQIQEIPSSWIKILTSDYMSPAKTIFQKLTTQWKNILPYFFFFRRIIKKKDRVVVMMEQFGLPELSIFLLFLFFFRPKIKLLLLHRFSLQDMGRKKRIYLFLHNWISRILKKTNLILLSDSDLIAESLTTFFKQKIEVVPIPHTASNLEVKKKEKDLFWWPGGSTRVDKGMEHIKNLSTILSISKSKYKLVVADSAKEKIGKNSNVIYIKSNLSPNEYINNMQTMGLILLPYLAKDYHSRTSGIFVEAVAMGGIPIVLEGTWMAYELLKYDLQELIIDFTKEGIVDDLERIVTSEKIKIKLSEMQQKYLKYHSVANYAARLKEIVQGPKQNFFEEKIDFSSIF